MQFREMLKNWIDAYAQAADRFRRGVLEAIGEFPENAYLPRFGKLPDVPRAKLDFVPDTS